MACLSESVLQTTLHCESRCALILQAEFCGGKGGPCFALVDKVKTYPVFRFGGVEGTKVCTLAFQKVTV
jgi:hypothetical protein